MSYGYELEEMETNMESMFDHVNSKADNNMTSLLPSPSILSEMKERNTQISENSKVKHAFYWSIENHTGAREKPSHLANFCPCFTFWKKK
jgi:hypothetical protein